MQFKKTLEIKADHKLMVIDVADILYIKASVNDCYIHMTSGSVYKTRSTLESMEAQVGEYFLKVHRTYLVCIMAIHALEDTLTLIFPGMELYENYPLLVKHKWLIPAYWCYRIVRLLFSKKRRDYVLREVKAVEKVAVRKNSTEAK